MLELRTIDIPQVPVNDIYLNTLKNTCAENCVEFTKKLKEVHNIKQIVSQVENLINKVNIFYSY